MATPGRGRDNSRLASQENITGNLQRRAAQVRREARPFVVRRGIHRVLTVDSITHDAAGTVKLVYHNGIGYTAAKYPNDDNVEIECRGYLLQAAEEIEANTAGFAMFLDDGTCEWISGNCAPRDWELVEEA